MSSAAFLFVLLVPAMQESDSNRPRFPEVNAPGYPAPGVRKINEFCAEVYRPYGKSDSFKSVLYPGVGHVYTPEMWNEMLEWFDGYWKG